MRLYKNIVLLLILSLLFAICAGCSSDSINEEVTGSYIMLKSKTESSLVKVAYKIKGESDDEIMDELMNKLRSYEGQDYIKPISDEVTIIGYDIEEDQANIYFGENYSELLLHDEVIMRAAIVETLCQIESVKAVCFYINDAPLTIQNKVIGRMNEETFINGLSFVEATTKFELFYPNKDCTELVKEIREVTLNSVLTDEKTVIDELLKGPVDDNLVKAIPSDTKLLSVVTKDKTCYVNFSEEFLNYLSDVGDTFTIYSIVNSLCELPGIVSVSITVEGSPVEFYNTCPIGEFLMYNYDLVPEEQ